jgi:hypothetical protein
MKPVFTTDNLHVLKIELGGDSVAEMKTAYIAIASDDEPGLWEHNMMFTCQVDSDDGGRSHLSSFYGGPPYFGLQSSKELAREFLLALRDHLGPLTVSSDISTRLVPDDLRERLRYTKEAEGVLVDGLLAEHFTAKPEPADPYQLAEYRIGKPAKVQSLPMDGPMLPKRKGLPMDGPANAELN